MQIVSCPSCGAEVKFRSAASVMAVCEYCKTTVLKDADSVKDLGKMSDVLSDYSPIQVGTSGKFGGQEFSVIGRIQLRYTDGLWNEWYLMFDDGHTGWLGDASGQYMITAEKQIGGQLPAFDHLTVSSRQMIGGQSYIASDVRTADCIGGQGELPFKVGEGWQARVADMRNGSSFLTLDYSDGDQPTAYTGMAVTLESMQCQLLRDEDDVQSSAGKYRGKVQPLSCPNCGSTVSYVPGMTTHMVCPACASQIDTSGTVAQVLEAGDRMAAIKTTLELGARANIAGAQYELIGVMRRADDENTEWTEYLLHNARAGFLWLVETSEGWFRAKVLDDWPQWERGDSAKLGGQTFRKQYEYPSRVLFAAGAFNWRVHAGDETKLIEFESGQNSLAAEMTKEELTWSLSSPVAADQIRAWFGKEVKADKVKKEKSELSAMAMRFIYGMLIFNAIPLLMTFGRTWFWTLLAAAAIYFPAKYLDSMDE